MQNDRLGEIIRAEWLEDESGLMHHKGDDYFPDVQAQAIRQWVKDGLPQEKKLRYSDNIHLDNQKVGWNQAVAQTRENLKLKEEE